MESNRNAIGIDAASCMWRPPQLLKVIWIGPTTGGLGWLAARIKEYQSPHTPTIVLQIASLDSTDDMRDLIDVGGDRLVIAVANRIDYPRDAIQWIINRAPELPLSVATDSWWDGSRRTGVGALPHLAMPWHRWWDGWVDWLDASSAELFGPSVLPMTYGVAMGGTLSSVTPSCGAQPIHGWVIANCAQSSEAWSLVAQQAGASVERHSASRFSDIVGIENKTSVDWILWDDSCLSTCGGNDELSQGVRFIADARRCFPHSSIYCAFSMPRWRVWESMARVGANEMLTKPHTGSGLRRLLNRL